MIKVLSIEGGIAIYQDESAKRLPREVFKELVIYLRSLFSNEFVPTLFADKQPGFIYFTLADNILAAIKRFFEMK